MMRRLAILHIEDNQDDAFLLSKACENAGLPADFYEVPGAAEAISYLKGEGAFADRKKNPCPDIVILDLKMPCMDGFAFLRWLRGVPEFLSLPVFVFTQSERDVDKARAVAEGATGYFV